MTHQSDTRPRTDSAATQIVGDVMTHTVIAVGPQATFQEIARTMHEWDVSAIPVLEGDGRVIGVVSEADLLPKTSYTDRAPQPPETRARMAMEELHATGGLTADTLMSTPAVSVHTGVRLTEAARIMARRHVKRLPVVDGDGRLVGIVSRADLLTMFLRADEEIAEEIRRDVLGLLPGGALQVQVAVSEGVATLTGRLPDASLVPVAARLVRSVEGVVDVRFDLG